MFRAFDGENINKPLVRLELGPGSGLDEEFLCGNLARRRGDFSPPRKCFPAFEGREKQTTGSTGGSREIF